MWKNKNIVIHMKKFREINVQNVQCGNYGNSLSRIFGKTFVKVTVLPNKLQKHNATETFKM